MGDHTTQCQYHSRQNAGWYCERCELPLCSTCIPGGDDNFRPGQPRCPLCVSSLRYLGDGQDRQPFWRAAPQLFRYAAHPPLLMMAVLSGLLSDSLFLADLFFLVVLIRYGLMIIVSIAHGDMQPPKLGAAISGSLDLFFKQLAVFVIVFAVPAAIMFKSPTLGVALLALVTLAVPASTMVLALTESLSSALNPLLWARLIWTIGWSYLLLWLAWSSVTSMPEALAAVEVSEAYRGMIASVVKALSFYTGVLGYAMMGYLLYQHGEALGLGAKGPRGRSLPQQDYERREALGRSHVLAQRGKVAEALEAINKAIDGAAADIELHERKLLLLRLDPDKPRFGRFADQYLRLLHAQQRSAPMANAFLDVRAVLPNYLPADADVRVALARILVERGRWREAKLLLVNLHSSHAQFAGLAEAYLLLARVYLEGLGNLDSAAKVLGFLQKNHTETFSSEQGRNMLSLYQRLRATS